MDILKLGRIFLSLIQCCVIFGSTHVHNFERGRGRHHPAPAAVTILCHSVALALLQGAGILLTAGHCILTLDIQLCRQIQGLTLNLLQ